MWGNLKSKFASQESEPLELRGGQVGSEKHSKAPPLIFFLNLIIRRNLKSYLALEVYVQLDLYCFGSKDWKGRTADAALARLDSDNSHSGCTL